MCIADGATHDVRGTLMPHQVWLACLVPGWYLDSRRENAAAPLRYSSSICPLLPGSAFAFAFTSGSIAVGLKWLAPQLTMLFVIT